MSARPTSRLVRVWRMLRLALHILRGLLTAAIVLPWSTPRVRLVLTREWSRSLLSLLGVRLTIRGTPLNENSHKAMVVANHVSWLDIYLLNAAWPARFVSKAEVRTWPVFGWLAEVTGTLFLERGKRRDTARINNVITTALNQGDCVAFFPEGTTTDGTHLRPFLASLLQPAIDAEAELRPVALRYLNNDDSINTLAAYYDEMSMMDSLRNILAQREIRAELHFLEPIACAHKTRRELARQSEAAISSALSLANPHKTPETPDGHPGAAH
ncbi:MAG: lysophospholipid acyltransferase family protein [Sulfurimicrobium sp.]|nr:lysophospholipid acyltransferase family protein [Sulfurimicrobium sp.]MDP1704895.1 lysophospholipid acyltransferase family protein [Sulfurimicrobium sp.]MDP3688525.1 lysophospholipid acyltransferase family protein [Sulfurimicrobium sp.]